MFARTAKRRSKTRSNLRRRAPLLAIIALSLMAAGCITETDPRLDDSDLFGSPASATAP